MDESKRVVPYSKGQALADEFGIQFFETSAKSNLKVDEVQNLTAIQCCCSCFVCSMCITLTYVPVLNWEKATVLSGRPYASVPFDETGVIAQSSACQPTLYLAPARSHCTYMLAGVSICSQGCDAALARDSAGRWRGSSVIRRHKGEG